MNALAYILYNAAIIISSPFIAAWYLAHFWKRGLSLTGVGERLGFVRRLRPAEEGGRLWLHAVSVGEAGVAAVLVPEILKRRPRLRIVISTVTETGREEAEKIEGVEYVFYLPFDLPFAVRSVLDRIGPSAIAIIETELWPNLVWAAARRGLPVCIVNGRLSEKSFRGYLRLRFLFASVLGRLAGVAARGEADAARYRALGAPGVFQAGNIKFDAPAPPGEADPEALKEAFGLAGAGPVIVAGSTHPGEEAEIGRAIRALRERFGNLGALIAPRHLQRLDDAEEDLRRAGLETVRWSGLSGGSGGGRVVLLDVMGKLGEAYGCATAGFIGGSLIPHGGQNPIEAARWGVPVVFGPHMANFAEVAEDLLRAGGAVQVQGPEGLADAFLPWLSGAGARDVAGASARETVNANRGAAGRAADFLAGLLDASEGNRG
ncbi:MAG: 3-deoxy-D-manno-octulosonic acid transferase [Nitrospinota bacterium]